MGKDKSWKLENTLKIDDKQLKTPKHDELCLWVDNHYMDLIRFYFNLPFNISNTTDQHSANIRESCGQNKNKFDTYCEKLETYCIFDGLWFEKAEQKTKCPYYKLILNDYNDFIKKSYDINDLSIIDFQWESPIKSNGFVIGIPDFTIKIKLKSHKIYSNMGFFSKDILGGCNLVNIILEVKPKIKSIGETMRQLKIYKSYLYNNNDRYYGTKNYLGLVTEDNQYKNLFMSQNITYICKNEFDELRKKYGQVD